MGTVIEDTVSRLSARLEELRPSIEEAQRIEAALAALRGSKRREPVTVLDALLPVQEDESADRPAPSEKAAAATP